MLPETYIGEDPPLNVTRDIEMDVPNTERQRIPVPEQSIVEPLVEPCRTTREFASRTGSVSLMMLLQLHLPEKVPDGSTILPATASRMNC